MPSYGDTLGRCSQDWQRRRNRGSRRGI